MRFSGLTDTRNLTNLCHQLVSSLEILRCVFLPHDYGGQYIQVFLHALATKVSVIRNFDEPLEEACARDCLTELKEKLIPGSPFAKFFIFQSPKHNMCQLGMGISHALYDGISLPQMAEHIGALYDGRPVPAVGQFSSYMNSITSATSGFSRVASCAHWRSLLQDAPVPTNIISNDSRTYARKANTHVQRGQAFSSPKFATAGTMFPAAWRVALARVTGGNDIVFGRAVSGRTLTSATADHESVIGPCLNLVPVRAKLSDFGSVSRFTTADKSQIIESLQSQFIDSISHETTGLAEIAR